MLFRCGETGRTLYTNPPQMGVPRYSGSGMHLWRLRRQRQRPLGAAGRFPAVHPLAGPGQGWTGAGETVTNRVKKETGPWIRYGASCMQKPGQC